MLLPELRAKMPNAELIVVQDGPDDGTIELCQSLAVLNLRGHEAGLGDAILTGILMARYDQVIVMDGDGQHPVSAVAEIATMLKAGHPLVLGARYERGGMSWARSFMSLGCELLTRPLCKMHDPMTGLFGLDRGILFGVDINININTNTWKIALEIAAKTGVEDYPVTYIFEKRIAGSSKASIKPAIQFLTQLGRLYAWKLDITQMMRFCVVGTSGLLVNVGIMTFLVELLRVDYRIAAIAGVTVAMLWNYVWNKFWTFKRGEHAKHSIGEGARITGHGEAETR
jgi:dolichol-phosphate mannosyltransferase